MAGVGRVSILQRYTFRRFLRVLQKKGKGMIQDLKPTSYRPHCIFKSIF